MRCKKSLKDRLGLTKAKKALKHFFFRKHLLRKIIEKKSRKIKDKESTINSLQATVMAQEETLKTERELFANEARWRDDYRSTIDNVESMETFLSHTANWVLQHVGTSNIAIYIKPPYEHTHTLGFYLGDDTGRSGGLDSKLRESILPAVNQGKLVQGSGETLIDNTRSPLFNQEIMAADCTYLGNSSVSIILFREASRPFTPQHVAMMRSIQSAVGVGMKNTLERIENPRETISDNDDWWKRGEEPPF